jgi:hypothetical protein
MKSSSSNPPYEETQIRCPKLGGPVNFEFCRVEGRELPCGRAMACWGHYFDVEAYFRQQLSPEDFEKCFVQPQPTKLCTLIELIEKARKLTDAAGKE